MKAKTLKTKKCKKNEHDVNSYCICFLRKLLPIKYSPDPNHELT